MDLVSGGPRAQQRSWTLSRDFAPLAAVAALMLAAAWPAAAQGIFAVAGNAGTEFSTNWGIILGAITYGLGPLLIVIGLYLLYQDRKYGTHGQARMAAGFAGIVVGCCIIGLVAFGTAGTLTFTGGAPSGGAGAALAF